MKSLNSPSTSTTRALTLVALLLATLALGRVAASAQSNPGGSTKLFTVAGGGLATNTPAKAAPMVYPSAVALDPLGRGFYAVDEVNETSLLRFVNTTDRPVTLAGATVEPGAINLIAGGGPRLEDGEARDVDLSLLAGLVVDPTGNAVYFVSPVTSGLRALNLSPRTFNILGRPLPPGQVTTLFAPSRTDFRSLALDPRTGAFYYIATATRGNLRVVYKVDATLNESIYAGGGDLSMSTNGDGGPAIGARLVTPIALAVDSQGNLLVVEGGDSRGNPPGAVRQVDTNRMIRTLADNLEFPTGIAVASDDTAYIALGNRQQILRLRPNGSRSIVAGSNSAAACDLIANPTCGDGGPALSAGFSLPGSTDLRTLTMAANETGFLIPDLRYRRVRYVNLSGGPVTIAGTQIASRNIDSVVGSGILAPYDHTLATSAELQFPLGVAADAEGNLYISDSGRGRLRFVNRTTSPITLFAGTPSEQTVEPGRIISLNSQPGQSPQDDRISTATFFTPQGLVVTSNGIFVVDSQGGRLYPPGSASGRRTGLVRFINTSSAEVRLFGDILIAPGQIRDVAGVRPNIVPSGIGDGGPSTRAVIFPTDIALDSAGNLYIADVGANNRIRKINSQTGIITSLRAQTGDGIADLITGGATGIALDGAGRLYIADTRNSRLLRQDAPGGFAFTVIANASLGLNRPRDLTVDEAGLVYVTNAGTHQVLRLTAPANSLGTVQVIAGTGQAGFSGDGGAGKQARLNLPNPGETVNDVQVTANIINLPNGDRAFTDANNNRVRLLVQSANAAPALAPVGNQSLDEGARLTLNFSATDENGDALTFTLTGKPTFGTFTDHRNGTASLALAPGFSDAGTYKLTLTVSDGDLSDALSFTLAVNDVTQPLMVSAAPIGSPLEATSPQGARVNLSGTASDPEGGQLSFKWFDGQAQIASGDKATVTLALGNHAIFLTVTDSRGVSVSTAAEALIVRDTTPPAFNNVPSNITVVASSPRGSVVNYTPPTASDLVDGAVEVTSDKPSGSFFPIGTTTVKFTASDSRGNAATASFTVTLLGVPGGNCVATVAPDHWRGEYFNNVALSAQPVMVRDDGNGMLDFNWKFDSPSTACGLGSDLFSVRWTRAVNFEGGNYRFTVIRDDGVRLYIDGVLRLDRWEPVAGTLHAVELPLAAGSHTLRVEYFENTRGAKIKLTWQQVTSQPGDNRAPVIDAIADQTVAIGQTVDTLITFRDPDGEAVTEAQDVTVNPPPAPLAVQSIVPASGKRGETVVAMITRTSFQPGAHVTLGGEFLFTETTFLSSTQLQVRIVVSIRAALGARGVTVSNPGGASATLPHAFTVEQ